VVMCVALGVALRLGLVVLVRFCWGLFGRFAMILIHALWLRRHFCGRVIET
jgi:hypothetical protein